MMSRDGKVLSTRTSPVLMETIKAREEHMWRVLELKQVTKGRRKAERRLLRAKEENEMSMLIKPEGSHFWR